MSGMYVWVGCAWLLGGDCVRCKATRDRAGKRKGVGGMPCQRAAANCSNVIGSRPSPHRWCCNKLTNASISDVARYCTALTSLDLT